MRHERENQCVFSFPDRGERAKEIDRERISRKENKTVRHGKYFVHYEPTRCVVL